LVIESSCAIRFGAAKNGLLATMRVASFIWSQSGTESLEGHTKNKLIPDFGYQHQLVSMLTISGIVHDQPVIL
jgi:hypothetical protein